MKQEEEEEADGARDDDSSAFEAGPEAGGPFTALRWSTRCFAMEGVCRIVAQCEGGDPAHFNMALAQERRLHESTGKLLAAAAFASGSVNHSAGRDDLTPSQTSWSCILETWYAWRSCRPRTTATSSSSRVCRLCW